MRTLLRLLLIFQGATRLQRWLSVCGAVLVVIAAGNLIGYGMGPRGAVVAQGLAAFEWLALVFGILGLIFGGSMMPIVFGALAAGHQLHLLPHGRGKLLSSAIAALLLPALVCAAAVMTIFLPYPVDHAAAFYKTLLVALVTFTLMDLAIWFVSRARSAFGVLGGVMLLIGCLSLPFRFIELPGTSILWIGIGTGVAYGAAVGAFLCLPRLRAVLQAFRPRFRRPPPALGNAYSSSERTALLLGTASPWPLAFGQAFPLLAATLFIGEPGVWLFYFALCSALTGAIASTAAARSRCLWLRARWSRAELFGHVERGFLRQNAYSVSVLLVLLVGIGSYREFSTTLLALGIPLLLLGTVASMYLGLMMTRGIGWLDGGCAVVTMTAMMAAAVYARGGWADQQLVIALEALLGALSVTFRVLALRRWRSLDWLMCRSERVARHAR